MKETPSKVVVYHYSICLWRVRSNAHNLQQPRAFSQWLVGFLRRFRRRKTISTYAFPNLEKNLRGAFLPFSRIILLSVLLVASASAFTFSLLDLIKRGAMSEGRREILSKNLERWVSYRVTDSSDRFSETKGQMSHVMAWS